MRKIQYADIAQDAVKVFTKKEDVASFPLTLLPLENSAKNTGGTGVLIANVRQVSIRVVDVLQKPVTDKWGKWQQRIGKKDPITCWDLVKSAFPFGEKMNEETHVFDGCIYENKAGAMRFFMTAIPVCIAEEMAGAGVQLFGGACRLRYMDTAENILFRYYARQEADVFWIIFPQGEGLRVLLLTDGLPKAAWYVSCHQQFREDEMLRCLHAFDGRRSFPEYEKSTTAQKQGVVLNTDLDLDWLYTLLATQGIAAAKEEYNLRKFIQ